MTTSAIEKIITAIGTALAPLDGGSDPIKIFSDRQGEPIEEGERPAINIRFVEDIHDVQLGMGECWHTAQIMLDVYDDSSATDTMTPLLSRIGASAWGLIAADLSLGGLASNGTADMDVSQVEGFEQLVIGVTPLRICPQPADYCGPYVLLASRANAGTMTGAIINADGGMGVRGLTRINGGEDL